MNFSRPHHQLIGMLLKALNAQLLREKHCFFAGGTALALRFGEFRESVDVDVSVAEQAGAPAPVYDGNENDVARSIDLGSLAAFES